LPICNVSAFPDLQLTSFLKATLQKKRWQVWDNRQISASAIRFILLAWFPLIQCHISSN